MNGMKNIKKGMAVVLSIALVLGLVPILPGNTTTAYADQNGSKAKTISGLGTGIIANPTEPTSENDIWQGSYVYFGTYGGSSVKYRVLDNNTAVFSEDTNNKTMLLDCDSILEIKVFDENRSNDWIKSTIRKYLNETFLNKYFSVAEQNAIEKSSKSKKDNADGNGLTYSNYASLSGEKIFFLDAKEATNTNYGYSNTNHDSNIGYAAANRKKTGGSAYWWLRSAHNWYNNYAGIINQSGYINGVDVSKDLGGVSPALNVNLSKVLFSSVISGTAGQTGAEYKLTIKDSDMTIYITGDVTRNDNTVTIPYKVSGNNSRNTTQVSVLLTDKKYTDSNAQVLYYSALNISEENETGTFTVPSDLSDKVCGSDYYAYIIAEDVNGEKETDYASEPFSITVPVKNWEKPTVNAINIGTPGIINPAIPISIRDEWKGCYVYFGKYNGTPVKYRVLDNNTSVFSEGTNNKTMLLDCDSILETKAFDTKTGVWADSDIRRYLNSEKDEGNSYDYSSTGFLTTAFSKADENAIASSTKSVAGTDCDGYSSFAYASLSKDKIFFLDAEEATNANYGYSSYSDAINRKKEGADAWWLRSWNMNTDEYVGTVKTSAGGIDFKPASESDIGVSPALNIDLSKVLFSSAIGTGKSSDIKRTSSQIGTTNKTEWKLTLKDEKKTVKLTDDQKVIMIMRERLVVIPYTYTDENASDTEKVTQISVMITDKSYIDNGANILYYGALSNANLRNGGMTGTGYFLLPVDLENKTLGTDYHVYILAEHVSKDNASDFASEPVEITKIYKEITSVGDILNIEAPSSGNPLDTTADVVCYDGGSVTANLKWYLGEDEVTGDNTTAGYNKTYTVKITLSPDDSCVFADNARVFLFDKFVTPEKNEDGTLTVTYTFPATEKDKLKSITAPAPVLVPKGTTLEDMKRYLPTQVGIVTEGQSVTKADVSWNTTELASGSYDPSRLEEQHITLKGTVTCPEDVNQNDVELTTIIDITISATEIVAIPEVNVKAGTYQENQSVTLTSATEGATIYYTTDGTVPSLSNGYPAINTKKYTAPISIIGEQGKTVSITIKAIAVKEGMYASATADFIYIIKIPHTHGFENAGWENDYNEHWHKCNVENCDDSEGSIKDKAAHDYEYTYTWSDNYKNCTAKRICKVCGYNDYVKVTPKAEVTQTQTCTLPELTTYTAIFEDTSGFTNQKKENVKTAEATGHAMPDEWTSNGNGTHSKTCQNPNCSYTETGNCSGGTATYFKKAVCSICNHEYGSLVKDTISPVINELTDNKTYCIKAEFTVTEDNLDKVTDTVGSKVTTLTDINGTYTLSAGNHKITAIDKAGNSTVVTVTVNEGHDSSDWIVDKVATVEGAGSRHKECTVCKAILEKEEIKKLLQYTILDGADSTWESKKDDNSSSDKLVNETLSIRGSGEVTKFVEVKVDGKVVDPSYYTVTEGSTIITFRADFLETLSTGVHSFELVWTDGTATTHFTVAKNTTDDKKTENTKTEDTEIVDTAPKTGDKNYPVFWKIMFTFSIMSLGLIAVTGRRKRKDI